MSRDEIYASGDADPRPFEFNESVARVFPDMLRRSIPGYEASLEAIGWLAARHVWPHTRCYDLGCSLGAAAEAMRNNVTAPGVEIIAVDNARAMVERCRQRLRATTSRAAPARALPPTRVLEADVLQTEIANASMVVMNYTLQFLPIAERDSFLHRVAQGMNENGIMVLSEKVVDEDETIEALIVEVHRQYKRKNAYSELEISRKRTALENVLIPERLETHRRRLVAAGFRHSGVLLRHFNFLTLVAIR